jgi:YD repeat-containing protein
MKKSNGVACLEVVLSICFLSMAHGQPVTSIYGTDAQKDGIAGKVKERVETVTQFIESGKSVAGMTETIRYDEQGRRLYYFQTRLDVEKWIPTELRYAYTGNSGRVDMKDGSYNLLSFDESARLKGITFFSASGKTRGANKIAYSRSGKPETVEIFDESNKPFSVMKYTANDDGTLTATTGTTKYVYNASGVRIKEEFALDGKMFRNATYDEFGNVVLLQDGYCPESSAADAKDIPTILRMTESANILKDSQGRITQRDCISRERGGVVRYDASMRVVAEEAFGGCEITSTRNTYTGDGKIGMTETELLESFPKRQHSTITHKTFTYDDKGRIKTTTEAESSGDYTENYLYRSDGKLSRIVRRSWSENYAYGETGLLIAKSSILQDTDNPADSPDFNNLAEVETYSYYDDGRVRSQKNFSMYAEHTEGLDSFDLVNATQSSKEFAYDAQGRCVVEKRINADGSATTVYYLYDSTGRVSNEIALTTTLYGGQNCEEKEYAYEPENGLLKRTEYRNVSRARYRYTYDEKGNVASCAVAKMMYDGKTYTEVPQSLTAYSYAYY